MKRNKKELKLIPVLKTRRKNRKIPVYQSPEVAAALQKEEEMLAKFGEGRRNQVWIFSGRSYISSRNRVGKTGRLKKS